MFWRNSAFRNQGSIFTERIPEILNGILYHSLMACIVIIFLICAYCVYDAGYLFYHAGTKPYRGMRPKEHQTVSSEGQISDEQVAWLYIEGTGIDDPVMQADDNMKYLNKDPYGDFALHGSLFLDYRNSGDFTDAYSVIYGHHMEHGLMFGCLDAYKDEAYLKEHQEGTVTGQEDIWQFHIFAVTLADAADPVFFDPEKYDRETLMKTLHEIAVYCEEPDGDLPVLGLSTCTGSISTTRLIVLGTLKRGDSQ